MLEQLQAIALQTQQASVPAQFLYATVTSMSPLTVQVDDRFYLTAPALVSLASHTHKLGDLETDENTPLTVGTQVVVLRNLGGQTYLLLGRVNL